MLRNEVGWFDSEENSADILNTRLANDATFVRAAFSNCLSLFVQDSAAIVVAFVIGVVLQWRVALIALACVPFLVISAIAQVGSEMVKALSFSFSECRMIVLVYVVGCATSK
jgi:ATP-binding cassette subfamily B (MDR/TAP) protein 1